MPNADFFARLGVFVARNFFDEDLRARICAEVRQVASEPSAMRTRSGADLNTDFRRSRWARVSPRTLADVTEKLLEAKPALERHFGLALEGCEEPQFLIYRENDFYRAHRDSSSDPKAADYLRNRRVSVVVFLNQQTEQPAPDAYTGGALTFFELVDSPELKNRGLRLAGEQSLLVGFKSDLKHEVTPVTSGERFTLVTWFF